MNSTFYRRHGKRLLDIFMSLIFLSLCSVPMLLITAILRVRNGPPVLFRQPRPGYKGKTFYLLKFRTMTDERDENGDLQPDECRLTRLGQLLRKLSLDELPELFNVLKGEMSLVGPRPLLVQYLDRYTPEQMRRHDVKPGITGWAQVNGRNTISWERKFELDVWYVDHLSLILDLKIVLKTVIKTLKQEAITQNGYSTASEFMGSRNRINGLFRREE